MESLIHSFYFGCADKVGRVSVMGCNSENRNQYVDKVVSHRSNTKLPGCNIMDTVGAEHT